MSDGKKLLACGGTGDGWWVRWVECWHSCILIGVLPHCCHAYAPNINVWNISGSDSFMFWYKKVSIALVRFAWNLFSRGQSINSFSIHYLWFTWISSLEVVGYNIHMVSCMKLGWQFFLTQNYQLVKSGDCVKLCEGVCNCHCWIPLTCAYLLQDASTTCCPSSSRWTVRLACCLRIGHLQTLEVWNVLANLSLSCVLAAVANCWEPPLWYVSFLSSWDVNI